MRYPCTGHCRQHRPTLPADAPGSTETREGMALSPTTRRVTAPTRGEAGAFTVSSVLVLVVVLAAAGITAALLWRTMAAAQSINDKAATIARTGRGINIATDSIIALHRTNQIAAAIRDNVAPLDEKLAAVITAAEQVDGTATSIDDTAGSIATLAERIDGVAATIDERATTIDERAGEIAQTAQTIDASATEIEGTASAINQEAAEIIDVAERIDADVRRINLNLDTTIGLAESILDDTGDIVAQARGAHVTTACIDDKLAGGSDGHCGGLGEGG